MRATSKDVALTTICAALYCVGSLLTAYIPTGFIIQLRPAVVIPAVFAVLFGPWIGGLGAALGTFIASLIRYGTPLLTLFSGTPANFVCFFLIGRLTWKLSGRLHWTLSYLIGNLVGYLAGFVIIAVGLYVLALITMGGAMIGLPWLSKWLNPLVMLVGVLAVGFLPEFVVSYLAGVPIIASASKVLPQAPFARPSAERKRK